jgi:hypothetical protein
MRHPLALILSVLLFGCASGPPGTAHPGAGPVLYTEQKPSEAELLSREAQAFIEALAAYLHLRIPPGPLLRIYHYPNRWRLWRHLHRDAPSIRWRPGACYETEEAYIVTVYGNPERKGFRKTLRHELTHYLVASHFCGIPPWIDEGLSEVMASGPPFPHLEDDLLDAARRAARQTSHRRCVKLLLLAPGEKLNASQYRLACALTYYLLTRPSTSAPGDLLRFLEDTRPDIPPERTFSATWGISIEEACQATASWAASEN